MGGNQNLIPAWAQAQRHTEGGGDRLASVVGGVADHIQFQQFRHHAGVLEDRLHFSVVGVGIAAVGGEEFRAVGDLVTDRGDIPLITARPQKADGILCGGVFGQ